MLPGKGGDEWILTTDRMSSKRIRKHAGKHDKYLAHSVGKMYPRPHYFAKI
jgi:hypothetical protein